MNCAGVPRSVRLVGREGPVDMARFEQVIRVNLFGTVRIMTKAAARMMALTRKVRIANAASSSIKPRLSPTRARSDRAPM